MRAQEFIPEASIFDERTLKNTEWKSPFRIIKWLKSNGFEEIGSGVFAAAYAKPTDNRVVKVSTRQDACRFRFADWAMTKTNNKHLPKIPWIHRYRADPWNTGMTEEFFVTIIERLQPLNDEAIARITDPGVLYGLYNYVDADSNTLASIENAMSNTRSIIDADPEKYKNHLFVKTILQIENLRGYCDLDLHSGNLMVRNDGTVVITDPIAS